MGTYVVRLVHVTVLTSRNGFTPYKLLSHEVLTEGYPMRLHVGRRPILVLLELACVCITYAHRTAVFNRPMTSLQIPQHATTRLLGVPQLLP